MVKTRRVWDGFFKVDLVQAEGKEWEVVRATPAICLLLYNKTRDNVILLTQSRASMVSNKNFTGIMTEVVAGRLDKEGWTPQEIASDEAWYEAGVKIPPEKILLLNSGVPVASSAGITNEVVYYAYGEITDDDIDFTKAVFGDPKEGEQIKRHFFSVEEFEKHTCDTLHTFVFKNWFLLMRWENIHAKR